jgi:hypothetical protein
MRVPKDPPFYPGSWLLGFFILTIGLHEYGGWVGIGAFVGFMTLHALIVEFWVARRRPERSARAL